MQRKVTRDIILDPNSSEVHRSNVIAVSFAREGAEISNDLVPVDVLGDFSLVASDEEWEAGYQDLLYSIQAVA